MGTAVDFSARVRCVQTAGWTKMPLGMQVGLGPGDFVLDGDPAPPEKRHSSHPIFFPCLLWPNGWMDKYATWHGSRPRHRPDCVRRRSSSPLRKGHCNPLFSAHVYCGYGRPSQLLLSFLEWLKLRNSKFAAKLTMESNSMVNNFQKVLKRYE